MLNQSFPEIKDYMVICVKRQGYKSRILKNIFKNLFILSQKQKLQYNVQKDFFIQKSCQEVIG